MARTPSRLRTKADFLVLGGGISGIAALRECKRLGISAIGLEASAVLGGRIRTVWNRKLARYPIELGPEFVHGGYMKELAQTLGLNLIRHPSDGEAYVDGQFRALLPILALFQAIRSRARAYLTHGGSDCNMESFLEQLHDAEPSLFKNIPMHLVLQLIRNDFAARVSELGVVGFSAPDVDGYEENYRITEGYSAFAHRLADGCDLRKNHVISAVHRFRDCVQVITNRGVFSGNIALVCLPVGVLQAEDVHLDPPFSREKMRAINSITAGTASKLVLSFRRTKQGTTFWKKDIPVVMSSLAMQMWWPTGWGYEDQRNVVISCLVGGAATDRFTGRDPQRVGILQLSHMFGRDKVEKKALPEYFVKSWHHDPRVRGGYSSIAAGVDHDRILGELRCPEDDACPRAVLGGEYVHAHPGSVHAGYDSGIDAVRRAVFTRNDGWC